MHGDNEPGWKNSPRDEKKLTRLSFSPRMYYVIIAPGNVLFFSRTGTAVPRDAEVGRPTGTSSSAANPRETGSARHSFGWFTEANRERNCVREFSRRERRKITVMDRSERDAFGHHYLGDRNIGQRQKTITFPDLELARDEWVGVSRGAGRAGGRKICK